MPKHPENLTETDDVRGLPGKYLLALLVFNLAACSTMRPVSVEDAMRHPPPRNVRQGSLVEVKTFDGRTARFRVTQMTDQGLGGPDGFYDYANMVTLQVDEPNGGDGRVAGYLLGVLGVAALIWLIGNADEVSVCSQPPCPTPSP